MPQRLVALARERDLLLHAHSDVDAVERLFKSWPQARILWAHSGFDRPAVVREMLRKHKQLWCDLAYRTDQASNNKVDAEWRDAFVEFPDRFMVGTDTFTPERWHYIVPHARVLARLAGRPATADRRTHRVAQRGRPAARRLAEEGVSRVAARLGAWAAAALGAAPIAAAQTVDCGAALRAADALSAEQDGVRVAFVPRPSPAPVGRHFNVDFVVCAGGVARTDVRTQVDADMPAHRHGMNYRASVAPLGAGVYRAEGLMFHMPGRWRLLFDLELDGRTWHLAREIEVQ